MSDSEKKPEDRPEPWSQWRQRKGRWAAYIQSFEWVCEWLSFHLSNIALFKILEYAGKTTILVALVSWFLTASDRAKQRHYQAWSVINAAVGHTGDGGRRDALQDLNDDHVSLAAAPLQGALLSGIRLPEADLSDILLEGADLRAAVLRGARLRHTNLRGADLTGADLREADLGGAINTTVDRINTARILCRTTLPDGTLSNRDCPPASDRGRHP